MSVTFFLLYSLAGWLSCCLSFPVDFFFSLFPYLSLASRFVKFVSPFSGDFFFHTLQIVDDVYVGPGASSNLPIIGINQNGANFYDYIASLPSGTIRSYCGRDNVMVFNGTSIFQVLNTVGLNFTSSSSFIQFDFAVGCGVVSSDYWIDLQFANNWGTNNGDGLPLLAGSVWRSLLAPQCNPVSTPTNCPNMTFQPPPGGRHVNTWFTGTPWTSGSWLYSRDYSTDLWGQTWTRVTIPLPSSAGVIGRRYRFVINRPSPNSIATEWAVSNLYIGAGCGGGCNGRGYCNNGVCACDAGFELRDGTCIPTPLALPAEFRETFNAPLSTASWASIRGGLWSSAQTLLMNSTTGARRAVTTDIDTRLAEFIEFTLSLSLILSTSNVVLSFSVNGGITWSLISVASQPLSSTASSIYVLPLAARSPATRFMWWQPLYTYTYETWALDDIYIGPGSARPAFINQRQDNFSSPNIISLITSGSVQSYCSRSNAVVMSGTTGFQTIETNIINMTGNAFVQFDMNVGCGTVGSDFVIEVHYIDTPLNPTTVALPQPSLTWSYVQSAPCNPATSPVTCTSWNASSTPGNFVTSTWSYGTAWTLGGVYYSRDLVSDYWGLPLWRRVTLPLPIASTYVGRRVRLYRRVDSGSDTWAISNMYVGSVCSRNCLAHGVCSNGACVCDTGFTLSSQGACVSSGDFPTELRETFENDLSTDVWLSAGGCGPSTSVVVTAGRSLLFDRGSTRDLVTLDMDSTIAEFMQFNLYSAPSSPLFPISVSFSVNGGLTWRLLGVSSPSTAGSSQYLAFNLPSEAKTNATRYRWWQPLFSSTSGSSWVRA